MDTTRAIESAPKPQAAGGGLMQLLQAMWKARISYIMLLPFLIPFVIFIVIPIFNSANLSLQSWRGIKDQPPVNVGFQNYQTLLSLQIIEMPRRLDETTGEPLWQCKRDYVTLAEVPAIEAAEGITCEQAYARQSDFMPAGYGEASRFSLGEKSYVIAATDHRFWIGMYNTVRYVFFTVLLTTLFGLLLALVLRKQSFLNWFLRTVFFLPSVTSAVAVTVIWAWIFRAEDYGLINNILGRLGLDQITFLANADWTLPVVILLAVWGGMGYNMILFLAGLQSIPRDLYEVAEIDGATKWQQFRWITLPLLRPTTLFVIVTGVIGAFQVFQSVYILFSGVEGTGGVLDSALTAVLYLYDQGFFQLQLGYASAIAWVLFIVIFALTLINLRVGRINEAY